MGAFFLSATGRTIVQPHVEQSQHGARRLESKEWIVVLQFVSSRHAFAYQSPPTPTRLLPQCGRRENSWTSTG